MYLPWYEPYPFTLVYCPFCSPSVVMVPWRKDSMDTLGIHQQSPLFMCWPFQVLGLRSRTWFQVSGHLNTWSLPCTGNSNLMKCWYELGFEIPCCKCFSIMYPNTILSIVNTGLCYEVSINVYGVVFSTDLIKIIIKFYLVGCDWVLFIVYLA